MTQSKTQSMVEAVTNVIVGYLVALVSQLIIFPVFNIDIPLTSNIMIGLWFTVVSLFRSYIVRRYFNKKEKS
tara:strand:+ start:402 stop:617 length:216 start_codon:yes stop_codon:yes gene_type:complete